MDLSDKKLKQFSETTDGIKAYNLITDIRNRITDENKEKIIPVLMQYAENGTLMHLNSSVVAKITVSRYLEPMIS